MQYDEQLFNELLIHAGPDVELTVLAMARSITSDLPDSDWLPLLTERVARLQEKCRLLAKCAKAKEALTAEPREFKAGERDPKVGHMLTVANGKGAGNDG